nr:MAG: Sulfotransferase family protein [Candidatus Kentron sp. TUN]VFK70274.1 MAG: Sulfotransferase family protein [Candidatus Kentron sp. TUN]
MRVFLVGLPKSGTTTLHAALVVSGLKSVHWYEPTLDRYVGRSMYFRYFQGQDPLLDFHAYDAVTQADLITLNESYWPQMDYAMLRAIRTHHPDCTFVLNYRDPEKVADSIRRWGNLQDRLHKVGTPGLPPGTEKSQDNLIRWITAHYANMRQFFSTCRNYFEYDIEDIDAPNIIGEKLDMEIKWWGVSNKNVAFPPGIDESARAALTRPER